MKIAEIHPNPDFTLNIVLEDGRMSVFDVRPFLGDEAFEDLNSPEEFAKVSNGGYFIEWACGADFSADTLEARWTLLDRRASA